MLRFTASGTRLFAAVFLGALAIGALGGASALYWLARDGDCGRLPREDLTLREMADLRHLIDTYKSEGSSLSLTARQASFLLREELEVPAWLEVDGARVRIEARLPTGGSDRCWSVTYRGGFEVEQGHAFVTAEELRLGHVEVAWWLGGAPTEVPPVVVDAGGAKLAEFFTHLRTLRVADDAVTLQVDDPRWMR